MELGLDGVPAADDVLQVVVRLLALELADAAVQGVDLVLGALADGALGLAVVCALTGELLGREVGDAARRRAGASFLRGRLRCRGRGGGSGRRGRAGVIGVGRPRRRTASSRALDVVVPGHLLVSGHSVPTRRSDVAVWGGAGAGLVRCAG